MEPSGRNRWQPVASRKAPKRLKRAKTVAVGCNRLRRPQNGKEGVDGSSPSEGFRKGQQKGVFLLSCLVQKSTSIYQISDTS